MRSITRGPASAALALLLMMLLTLAAGPAATASTQTPEPLAGGQPGDLVRWQPLPPIGEHQVWRVLYISTGLDGEATAISGTIAIPAGQPPEGGFPLLAIGHPTAGLGQQCAPSLDLQRTDSFMGNLYRATLLPYLDAGFALVMSDYQGLGTAGDPSYLIGQIEGQNVLDSIRAARQFRETRLSETTLLIGHSQGGHAVAFALQLAPVYAPEVTLDGAVLAAPAIDPTGIFEGVTGHDLPSENTSLVLFVMSAWADTYPQASLEQVTTASGAELIETSIANACLIEATLAASDAIPSETFLPDAALNWAELAAANTPSAGPWEPPMLIVHGVNDEVIGIELSTSFVDHLCANGVVVEFREYPATDHFGVLAAAVSDILEWLQARVGGEPAPTTCSP